MRNKLSWKLEETETEKDQTLTIFKMYLKGLDDAATCKSKEFDSVTLSSPSWPSRTHLSLKHLTPKETSHIQRITRDTKLRSVTFLKMKGLPLNYSYILKHFLQ